MSRKVKRRATAAPRLDVLEARTLLSVGTASTLATDAPAADMVLVGFSTKSPSAPAKLALQSLNATIVKTFPDGPSLVALGPGVSVDLALARLKATPSIRYAEADHTIQVDATIPNDPKLGQLWGLSNLNNVDIDAPEAWDITTGNPSTIVAVIDSGIDLTHPEFAGRIWTNPAEIAGNHVDDDRDGFVDDVHGWNFLNNSPNVQDNDGHGTHVSGTIAATANNANGVAGINWAAKIMPLKFIGADGSGVIDDAVSAIYYAVDHGARVINASWGGDAGSQALDDAINFANSHNVVFVTAAGNDALNNDFFPSYPANDPSPNVLSVAAVDQNGNLASFSDYGPNSVDIAAPGVNILSTVPGGYDTYTGTSMAVPHVTGVVSLLVGLHPELTAAQLVNIVVASAKPLPSLQGKVIAGGMVDAYYALLAASGTATTTALGQQPVTSQQIETTIFASDEYYQLHGGTPAGFIDGLYQDLLGRPADPYGIQYWSNELALSDRGQVTLRIMTSVEAYRTRIARWFVTDLGRPASTLESLKADPTIDAWANNLDSGIWHDSDVLTFIFASDEYYQRHGGTVSGYLDGLYEALLGRPVDALGLQVWGNALASTDRGRVALGIMTSPEAGRTKIARWFQTQLHRIQPLDVLKNDPTIANWGDRLIN